MIEIFFRLIPRLFHVVVGISQINSFLRLQKQIFCTNFRQKAEIISYRNSLVSVHNCLSSVSVLNTYHTQSFHIERSNLLCKLVKIISIINDAVVSNPKWCHTRLAPLPLGLEPPLRNPGSAPVQFYCGIFSILSDFNPKIIF